MGNLPAKKELIWEKIKTILHDHLNINEQEITYDTTFQDLEADSVDVVEIAMSLEDEFEIEIPDELLENIKNIQQLVDFINEALE